MNKNREKYERKRRQRATENMRKAFERFNTAMTIMSGAQDDEEWTPEELERVTKIVNQWASTVLRIAEKTKERSRQKRESVNK